MGINTFLTSLRALWSSCGKQPEAPQPQPRISLDCAPADARILIADDYPGIATPIETALRKADYKNVSTVTGNDYGRRAVEAIKNGSCDVLIVDIEQPPPQIHSPFIPVPVHEVNENGIKLLACLVQERRKKGAQILIIAMTDSLDKRDVEVLGADGFLNKLQLLKPLKEVLENIMGGAPKEAQEKASPFPSATGSASPPMPT